MQEFQHKTWFATSIVDGHELENDIVGGQQVLSPYKWSDVVGISHAGTPELADFAVTVAVNGQEKWQAVSASERANILRNIANLYEENYAELMVLCQREAGKTMQDSIDEIREAVDFCRFYADEAERLDGEIDEYTDLNDNIIYQERQARGTMVCISPWNFPLAIFTGQIVACLVTGNTVVAKPAEQTSLVAHYAIQLMHKAGVPHSALQLVLGGGDVGSALTQAKNINGVIFTGSTRTAQLINQSLYSNLEEDAETPLETVDDLPILIAETGGQNAMIVDSTALPEQIAIDAVMGAFGSAGQRCSACRILCVQEDIAKNVLELVQGHMAELSVGNPLNVTTDVGPVIDKEAQSSLLAHIEKMKKEDKARVLYQTPIAKDWSNYLDQATFVQPTVIEVDNIEVIGGEHFGPILHVLPYKAKDLDKLIDQINATGYGLTMGIHSRIESTSEHIERRSIVGNTYVNRNQIGAVVNVQPFGGNGLSGTGPKAGGPHYLARLMKWVIVED